MRQTAGSQPALSQSALRVNARERCDHQGAQQPCLHANGQGKVPLADGSPDRPFMDIGQLVSQLAPESPLLCFSAEAARSIIERFMAGFCGLTTFAVKAAPLPEMIRECAWAGMTAFDVASPAEMALVRAVVPDAALHYNNPIKSEAEITAALTTYRVRHTTVDDLAELTKLMRAVNLAGIGPADMLVSVRVAASENSAVHDFRGKFGIAQEDAPRLLAGVAAAGFRCGLSFHPGSQCEDPQAYAREIANMARIAAAADVRLDVLNVGGGFPASYGNSRAPELEQFFSAIQAAYQAHFEPSTQLIAEPGRALSAPACSLLTRVKHRRANGDLFLNDGIYGGLLEQTQASLQLPLRFWRLDAGASAYQVAGKPQPVRVYGPTCDPLDVLPGKLQIPDDIAAGDWVEFGLAGAYSSATATRFNGYGVLQLVEVEEVCT